MDPLKEGTSSRDEAGIESGGSAAQSHADLKQRVQG